ncbi:MAG: hypothetical protein IKS45_08720 [Thermoguttaceae bacterium]|nr:hypothetical protein [Thermoguttaceae bacterium]MBR6436574.1 hypothetical protein [Thermoguttaceae bacterium]
MWHNYVNCNTKYWLVAVTALVGGVRNRPTKAETKKASELQNIQGDCPHVKRLHI